MVLWQSVTSGYRIVEITTENTGLSKYRLLTVNERERETQRQREKERERELLWSL